MMDFYIIHHYAFFDPPGALAAALAQPRQSWPVVMTDANEAFERYVNGRELPIAITEYNLIAFQDMDNEQLMTRAVNMLFLADTVGQMLQNGVAIANQWDLANGQPANGTDYGLLNADTFARSPQYYVFPLWAAFGQSMLPVNNTFDPLQELSVYAGQIDEATISLLAINKTDAPITAEIGLSGLDSAPARIQADVVAAESLQSQSVTFNGLAEPADDLSDAPPEIVTELQSPLAYTFIPYSVTLLQITLAE